MFSLFSRSDCLSDFLEILFARTSPSFTLSVEDAKSVPRSKETAAAPEGKSGGRSLSQGIGMAKGIGFVFFMPSVASLDESRLSRFADIVDLAVDEFMSLKACLKVRFEP